MELNDRQKEIFEKLVHSGASKEFAMYVLAYPDSHVAHDFMSDLPGGGFYKKLRRGDLLEALFHADLENERKLKEILFGDNGNRKRELYCATPAFLEKKK